MKTMDRLNGNSTKIKYYSSRLHRINAIIFVIIVYCFALLASYYSYVLERDAVLQNYREASNEIFRYYDNKQEEFWTVFIPAFQRNDYYQAVTRLMDAKSDNELADAVLRGNLVDMLNLSASQDTDIAWILLYKNSNNKAYVFNPFTKTISEVSADFPYLSQLKEKDSVRAVYGARTMTYNNEKLSVYGIAGDAYTQSSGSLLVGYRIDPLNAIYKRYVSQTPARILITTTAGDMVYNSSENYAENLHKDLHLENAMGRVTDNTGKEYYVETIIQKNRNYMVSFVIDNKELNRTATKNTLAILGTCTLFAFMAASLHFLAGHLISRRVSNIIEGLKQIGKHNLSYRISLNKSMDEFSVIAHQINEMNEELESNIQKLYVYELRQKTAELGELQSKFNPHFLYNTLEVIRGQLQEKGNHEASQMIMLLAKIFRSFITGKPFVSIREEITYCNNYLELFKLRYLDKIRIVYDMETAVLSYGIIRNLLQPVMENYFVHGFDPSKEENLLTISGRIQDNSIVLTVEDNGLGMSSEQLEQVSSDLLEENSMDNAGYGLKNINDRIKIFYGSEYGIILQSRLNHGTIVTMRIKKLSCEEHQNRMKVDL